jgi:uncharacterized protein YxeA
MRLFLIIAFFLVFKTSIAQETSTFKIKKEDAKADTVVFSINQSIYATDTLFKSDLNTSLRLFASDEKLNIIYFELQLKTRNNKTVTFWRNSNSIDNEIKKYLRKVKSGNEVCITYVSAADKHGNTYKSNFCFIVM